MGIFGKRPERSRSRDKDGEREREKDKDRSLPQRPTTKEAPKDILGDSAAETHARLDVASGAARATDSESTVERVSFSLKSLLPSSQSTLSTLSPEFANADAYHDASRSTLGGLSTRSAVVMANVAAENARKSLNSNPDIPLNISRLVNRSLDASFPSRIPTLSASPDSCDRASERRLKDMEDRVEYLTNGMLFHVC